MNFLLNNKRTDKLLEICKNLLWRNYDYGDIKIMEKKKWTLGHQRFFPLHVQYSSVYNGSLRLVDKRAKVCDYSSANAQLK